MLTLLIIGQYFTFLIIDNPAYPWELNELRKGISKGTEVFYLGDSVLSFNEPEDTDKRYLPQMLEQELGVPVQPVNHASNHMLVYQEVFRYLQLRTSGPITVVLPINLRIFSPEISERPSYQFERQRFIFHYAANPWIEPFLLPALVFKAFPKNPKSLAGFRKTEVYYGKQSVGKVADFEHRLYEAPSLAQEGDQWIYYYGYGLTRNHPQFQSFEKIIDMSVNEPRVNLVTYITPIDYQGGVRTLGERFSRQIQKNISLHGSLYAGETN